MAMQDLVVAAAAELRRMGWRPERTTASNALTALCAVSQRTPGSDVSRWVRSATRKDYIAFSLAWSQQ